METIYRRWNCIYNYTAYSIFLFIYKYIYIYNYYFITYYFTAPPVFYGDIEQAI